MAGRFSIESVFKAVDRVTVPVSRMQNKVGKLTRRMSRGFTRLDKKVQKVTAGLKKAAVVSAAGLLLVGTAAANVAITGADFEQAITNVGAVSLQTRSEIAPLEQMALRLGKTTKFTATQAANAMEILKRAGFENNEVLQATPAILNAAAASGMEIAEVADHVSNALKGMGMETSEAARVADVLALASSKTNSTIGSLGESLRNVSSTARELGIDFEDVVASVALLQDVGLDASVAGSAFNTMLTKMAAPTSAMQVKMHKFGISFKDAKGNMLPFQEVLQQLNIASKKAGGNFDKVAFLAELVGLRGQKAASNLGRLFETGKLDKLIKQLRAAKGSAEKMADLRMDTVQGSWLLLNSAIDAVKVNIFNLNRGPLKDAIDGMIEWVVKMEQPIAENITKGITFLVKNFKDIVSVIKKIGIGIGIFFALIAVLKTFIVVMTAANIVMAMNPIGLIVLAVMALIAGVTALIFWWNDLSAEMKSIGAVMSMLLGPIGMIISAALLIMDAWEPLKEFFADLWDGIITGFKKVTKTLSVEATSPKVSGLLSALGPVGALANIALAMNNDKEEVSSPQVVSSEERIARSIEEKKEQSTSEVTIKAEGVEAAVTGGVLGKGLKLEQTGAFQ